MTTRPRPRPLARLVCWVRGHDRQDLYLDLGDGGPLKPLSTHCKRCRRRLWRAF